MSEPLPQLSAAEVANMPPAAIAEAHRNGRLTELLAGRDPGRPPEVRDPQSGGADQGARGGVPAPLAERLKIMTADEIVAAHKRGDLDALLRGED